MLPLAQIVGISFPLMGWVGGSEGYRSNLTSSNKHTTNKRETINHE